jgi:hypothetical protein
MDQAIRQALDSRAGNLLSIAKTYFPELSASGYLKKCPWCGDKGQTFAVKRATAGNWYWGCHNPSCAVNIESIKTSNGGLGGDAIGLIATKEGKSRDEAIDLFLNMAGVHNPRHDLPPRDGKKSKKSKPPKADPAPPPSPSPAAEISLTGGPEEPAATKPAEPTVWDDLYSRLSLSASDRENLKRKRGFTRETIEAAGYRSSGFENRAALAPLLENYPHGLLLSEGIAVKCPDTGEIKINSQLCGMGLKKRATSTSAEEWDWVNPILIPYRDKHGRIFKIRPHKGGLSGKSYMRSQGFELAFRSTRTRTHLYTSFLFWNRPEGWEKRCVITEGEHKANALAQCGIPACAVPGIQMPRNEVFFEEMVATLRDAGIREVIIAYDNEDKSHKADPWDRYDVEVYALFACHALRGAGFLPSHCILPEEWRIDGKADWDGALAQFGDKAESKFKAALKKAKPYFPQTEIFGTHERDRVVHCKLNRLIFTPKLLTGGDEEEELAKLILKTPHPWRKDFNVRDLAAALFDTRGCYYVHSKPPKEVLIGTKNNPGLYEIASAIRRELDAIPPEDLERKAGVEAALAAVNLLIKGTPEILSDFTISCDYQVRTQSGEVHRLFRFKNKHGQTSQLVTVPPQAISTSSKFREFAMGIGNFNANMGDKHLQFLMQDLGTFSAWREIRELEMIGRDPESNLWIFGDCAFSPNADLFAHVKPGQTPDVIFADKHDIIWHDGIGYRVDPTDLSAFAHHTPPRFFQVLGKSPQEIYQEIKANPDAERLAVAKIFFQFAADLICTFGDSAGLLVLGGVIAHAMAPELLAKYHGHPGIWIHGRAFSGKSETSRFLMQTWGFDSGYKTFVLSGGTTAAFIDRVFSQYCDVPVHADEFRQKEADDTRIASLRAPFNRQSKGKAKMDQTNKTRLVNPMTSPIVTGEGVTKDSATLSRYVEAILAADKRLGTKEEQGIRFQRMLGDSSQYHRIVRYLLWNRKWFGKAAIANLDAFINAPDVSEAIKSDRVRLSYGTAYAAFKTLIDHFNEAVFNAIDAGTLGEMTMSRSDLTLLKDAVERLRDFSINYAQRAAADVISINFIVKYWSDVVTFMNINSSMKRFIWFERCIIDQATNKVTVTNATEDTPGLVRCVLVKPKELYEEYAKESRQRGRDPELSLSNIRAECQNERYWVPAPKTTGRQAHRIRTKDHGQIDVWVLRCDRMEPAIEAIFAEQFEGDDDEEKLDL